MRVDDPDWDDEGIVSLYIGTFAARDDLYVENGAEVRREPLRPDTIRKAIRHRYAVSAYMGAADGRTHVGALDLDVDEGGHTMAEQVRDLLDEHNIPASIVGSRRGAHLWVTSCDWVKVGEMHRMLTAAVGLALGNEAMENPKIEVFPKIGAEELAVGALRLPGLNHHKTQVIYPFNGIEQPTFRQIIEGHMLTTGEAIRRLAGTGPRRRRYPKALDNFYGFREKRAYGPAPKATEVLSSWGVTVNPGGTVKCPKHQDRHRSLTVFKDDERVYCGAPHCPLNGGGHGVGSVALSKMEG